MGEPTDLKLDVVQEDARGVIYSLRLPTNQELMLFFTRAGYLRGGHTHDAPEAVLVLTGRVLYHKVIGGREEVSEKEAGDIIYNLPGEPHMAEFTEDAWVIEWKIGVGIGQWTTTDYETMRSLVKKRLA